MEWVPIILRTEVENCLGTSNFCRSKIVDCLLGTFLSTPYEACRESMISLRGNNDRNVGSAMVSVHEQLLRLRGSIDAVPTTTQLFFETDPWIQIWVVLTPAAPPAIRLSMPLFKSMSLFFKPTRIDFLPSHHFLPHNLNRRLLTAGVN